MTALMSRNLTPGRYSYTKTEEEGGHAGVEGWRMGMRCMSWVGTH